MKKIPLSKEQFTLVDDDFEWLSKFNWREAKRRHTTYVVSGSNTTDKEYFMHRLIAEKYHFLSDQKPIPDHINGNGLDNRKENLRAASTSNNSCNRKVQKNCKSGYKGVSIHQGLWRSEITIGNKRIRKSGFKTKEEAAKFYNENAIKLHGEYARLNEL
jgi:hypothetical protein